MLSKNSECVCVCMFWKKRAKLKRCDMCWDLNIWLWPNSNILYAFNSSDTTPNDRKANQTNCIFYQSHRYNLFKIYVKRGRDTELNLQLLKLFIVYCHTLTLLVNCTLSLRLFFCFFFFFFYFSRFFLFGWFGQRDFLHVYISPAFMRGQ